MEQQTTVQEDPATRFSFNKPNVAFNRSKALFVIAGVGAVVAGVILGYFAATSPKTVGILPRPGSAGGTAENINVPLTSDQVRDQATGTLLPKPSQDKNVEGSHILKRDGSQFPVYLISNLIDLSRYENKHVKVSGVTYDCGKGLWCLEVNKIE